jgi:hypothetical protein
MNYETLKRFCEKKTIFRQLSVIEIECKDKKYKNELLYYKTYCFVSLINIPPPIFRFICLLNAFLRFFMIFVATCTLNWKRGGYPNYSHDMCQHFILVCNVKLLTLRLFIAPICDICDAKCDNEERVFITAINKIVIFIPFSLICFILSNLSVVYICIYLYVVVDNTTILKYKHYQRSSAFFERTFKFRYHMRL